MAETAWPADCPEFEQHATPGLARKVEAKGNRLPIQVGCNLGVLGSQVTRIAMVLIALIGTEPAFAQDGGTDAGLPKVIVDDRVEHWVVDRFAGNTKTGTQFFQGPAREVGTLQRPGAVVETPEGVYIAVNEEGADNPNLLRVQGGMLRLVMEREGLLEGPMELCQGGSPLWNDHDNTLYLLGPYCIRKVVVAEDGSRTVEVVAGTPNVAGSVDGPALSATLQRPKGWAAAQDGAIYWMEAHALRKFADGIVSTVPLTRPETPGWLWHVPVGGGLSRGEDANTLYVSNYYDTTHGYSILKCDLSTNEVTRIIGVDAQNPNHGKEMDGPATTSAAFSGGARGIYHPEYRAIFLSGADSVRYRWWRLDGDGWVRTLLGTLRPGTESKPFGITEANGIGNEGEQFRIGSSIVGYSGVGANGGVYLISVGELTGVWRAYDKTVGHSTASASGSSAQSGSARIYAARVGADGRPMDPSVWTELAPSASGVQAHPRVAYHDGTFLVVWHDLRSDTDFDVLGVRVASDGTVLDTSPIQIGTGPRNQSMPDVAADDQGFMVVWGGFHEEDLFPHIFAARVGADGAVGPESVITDGATPRIAWNSDEGRHMVVYSSAYNNYMAPTKNWLRMDPAKNVAPQEGSGWIWASGRDPNRYSVCAIPRAAQGWTFVTDHQPGNSWGRSVGVQRAINIDPDGAIAADSPTAISKAYIESTTAAANWLDNSRDLTKEWPYGGNAIAPDGEDCVAVWGRYHIGGISGSSLFDSDLYASRVDRWDPIEESPVAVATSAASERNPELAGDGNGNLVAVYEKLVEGAPQIVTRPLTVTTQLEVGTEVAIMDASGVRRGFPDIEFGGGSDGVYLVVWQEGWHGEGAYPPPPGPATDGGTLPPADGGPAAGDGGSAIETGSGGCGCSSASPSAHLPAVLLLLLVAPGLIRRRQLRP